MPGIFHCYCQSHSPLCSLTWEADPHGLYQQLFYLLAYSWILSMGITKQIGRMVESEVRIFTACLLPWQVFSVGYVPQLLFLKAISLDFGNCSLSSLWDWRDISSLFLPTPFFEFPLYHVHIFVEHPLQIQSFSLFKQMCHLFLDGTLIATPIYLTAVITMPPVTIYFDVHFYLCLNYFLSSFVGL